MSTQRVRRLPFTGAVNFRDLGGYRTRDGRHTAWGKVYRSDSLCQLTEQDHLLLDRLAIRTLCDFRKPGERKLRPNRLPATHAITVHEIGFLPDDAREIWAGLNDRSLTADRLRAILCEHYRLFAVEFAPQYRRVFDLLLTPGALPILIHCASGKDRTGFGSALILAALGVPYETIVEDYVLSDHYRRTLAQVDAAAADAEVMQAILQANPLYLQSGFAAIESRWGSLDAYFEDAMGLTPARRAQLQALLLYAEISG